MLPKPRDQKELLLKIVMGMSSGQNKKVSKQAMDYIRLIPLATISFAAALAQIINLYI